MSKRTVDLEPENSTYLDTYAWILHKLGKNEEAKQFLSRQWCLAVMKMQI